MKAGYLRAIRWTFTVILVATVCATAQITYQPKFPGDPAHSDSEAAALGYMRTLLRAQHTYKKKNGKYATSLADLVHTGTFTKRMVNPDRGDYLVTFHSHKDKDEFELLLTPKQQDPEHRSFYSKEDGVIHVEEDKTANADSPKLK
jgi:hypothetical protein